MTWKARARGAPSFLLGTRLSNFWDLDVVLLAATFPSVVVGPKSATSCKVVSRLSLFPAEKNATMLSTWQLAGIDLLTLAIDDQQQ